MTNEKSFSKYGHPGTVRNDLILQFNSFLETKANFFSLNEKNLEDLIAQLDDLVPVKDHLYWLTLARICELAINCAGNYANNGEFSFMGDLLLNPRRVLVHIRGRLHPIVKQRHTLLTDQFCHMADSKYEVMQWLKQETIVEIKVKALLPDLLEKLEHSGFWGREYLDSIHHRTQEIAELVQFLQAAQIHDNVSLFTWLKKSSSSDQALVQARLFRPDLHSFFYFGQKIRQMAHPFLPGSNLYNHNFLSTKENDSSRQVLFS